MVKGSKEFSHQFYARLAGAAYLLIIIIALLATGFADAQLVIPGDDAATVKNIMANDFLFRISVVGILIMYAIVVILAWALYILLKTAHKNLALLGLMLRTSEAVLGAATVLISFFVLSLVNDYTNKFETEQLQALVGLFLSVRTAGLDIVLIFVGLGGMLFCYLFYTSRAIPRLLAAWGILTYLSMLLLGTISILFPGHPIWIESVSYSSGGLFELVIGIWLLIFGVKTAP
jgi:hypothetical protein